MARRIEQINQLLKAGLANLISRRINLAGGLITVSYVDCTSDLKWAKIGVSVLPEKFSGTALVLLKKNSGLFSKIIIKKTRLRQVPRFNWLIDNTEAKAAEIEEFLNQIKRRKKS